MSREMDWSHGPYMKSPLRTVDDRNYTMMVFNVHHPYCGFCGMRYPSALGHLCPHGNHHAPGEKRR